MHYEEAEDSPGPWPRDEDALELRRQFLSIERGKVEALLDFLNCTGVWMFGRKNFELYELWQDQDMIRTLLTHPPRWDVGVQTDMRNIFFENFLYERSPYHVEVRGKRLVAQYALVETRSTLFLSAWLDFARGARFRFCARPDCSKHRPGTVPFELTSHRKRRYCTQYCAHLESMRRNRAKTKPKKGREA